MTGAPAFAEPDQVLVKPPPAEQRLPRTDVQTACPDIADTLNQELTSTVTMHGKEGTVSVPFRLQGGQVRDVVSRGSPGEYRLPIRRALRGLLCLPGQDGDRFAFSIRFDLNPEPASPQRLAQLVAP